LGRLLSFSPSPRAPGGTGRGGRPAPRCGPRSARCSEAGLRARALLLCPPYYTCPIRGGLRFWGSSINSFQRVSLPLSSLENGSNSRCDAVYAQFLSRQNIRKTKIFNCTPAPAREHTDPLAYALRCISPSIGKRLRRELKRLQRVTWPPSASACQHRPASSSFFRFCLNSTSKPATIAGGEDGNVILIAAGCEEVEP